MYNLVIFNFETGDADCVYWQELALVDSTQMDYGELEDSLTSYLDSVASDEKEYKDMVSDVLSASGWDWKPFAPGATINQVYSYWI